MKRIILYCVMAVALTACTGKSSVDPYHPVRPSDIPETTCDGTPIEWNWEKQRAYNEGKITLLRSNEGCVIAVVRKIK